MKKAIIFRDSLLMPSETFIKTQAEALTQFKPVFAGLRPASAARPFSSGILMTNSTGVRGKIAALAYRFTSFAPRFHRALKEQGASLIHAHFAVDGAAALSMRQKLNVPLIVTLHGYDVTTEDAVFERTIAGRRYLTLRPTLFDQASRFLCISEAIREKAISRGFPEKKLTVHYIGINCELFRPPSNSYRKQEKQVILFVGRLAEVKGCAYLIRAFADLEKSEQNCELVIVGDGPLRKELEQLATNLKVKATFTGTQPASIVREWIAKSRVVCVPSITTENGEREGFGLALIEAQAMGVPVVSSRSGGIPEAVKHGETGLLAPERDYRALRDHLKRFIRDEPFWQQCSARAREQVTGHFDLRRQTARLEEIYREVDSQSTA
jgi:colanic acid/amylovoran biosynthesis glycosyltransferase